MSKPVRYIVCVRVPDGTSPDAPTLAGRLIESRIYFNKYSRSEFLVRSSFTRDVLFSLFYGSELLSSVITNVKVWPEDCSLFEMTMQANIIMTPKQGPNIYHITFDIFRACFDVPQIIEKCAPTVKDLRKEQIKEKFYDLKYEMQLRHQREMNRTRSTYHTT